LYLDGTLNFTNSSVVNNTLTNVNVVGISGGEHSWYVSCADGASNINTSETRNFYVDIYPPTFSNISYSPNTTDNVDPSTTLTFNASISEDRVFVDTVILQYYNGSTWANATMTNTSLTNYNTTIITQSQEANYLFNVWANDTFSNAGNSSNTEFNSMWDCTWAVTPSTLDEIVGFYIDKVIGNVTINNTGDVEYLNNNCSVNFSVGYTGFSQDYALLTLDSNNWYSTNRYFQYASPINVNAGGAILLQINASFPSTDSPFTETPTITLTSNITHSISGINSSSVSSTLIISPPNPILYQSIEDYPSTFVYLTPGSFNLSAYVRNLGGDGSAGNTAYNVSFNWTLPSELASRVAEGNVTSNYTNLSDSTKAWSNLTINFTSSNLESMSKGSFNVTIYSYGYKNDSSLVVNSGNQTLLNNTITIQFLCYDVADSVCVSACGIGVDPDCVASSGGSSSGGGGGGGSAGGDNTEYVKSSQDLQLVRGKENIVKVVFKNKEQNISLKNLEFSVEGRIAKYISISPKTVESLAPEDSVEVILEITSPTYIGVGREKLTILMTAKKGVNTYKENKELILEIHELSGDEAKSLLSESEELMKKFKESNLSYDYLDDLLNKSQSGILEFNYELVRDNNQIIKENVEGALGAKEIIDNLNELISVSHEKGIDVSNSERLVKLAELSLDRKEFVQAYKRAQEAQLTYSLETKGEFGKVSYYVKKYPVQLSLSLLFLLVFSVSGYKTGRLQNIKRKIRKLEREEKLITELIALVQEETFKKGKMSMDEYRTSIKQYQKRFAEVIEELIELETKRIHALKFTSKEKRMKQERERIIEMIKGVQKGYLEEGKIETRAYELRLESYNKKLTDIDEGLALLEAKRALRRSFGFGRKVPKV